jgi:membrane protease YdiL (CAAX protease family)
MWSDGPCGTGLHEVGEISSDGLIEPAAVAAAPRQKGRLIAWFGLAGVLAAIAYAGRLSGGEPPDDVLYLWSTFVGALIQYAIMFALILWIARGLNRPLLALEAPQRRLAAVGWAVVALVVIVVATGILSQFLDAGDEQGLVPHGWDSARAAPFIANAAVVSLVAPFVEELLYRGLGFGLLRQFVSPWPAILITGLAFGLAHGLVLGLPVLSIFGFTLGWLRWKTGSVYPGMCVHALFNATALLAAVLT